MAAPTVSISHASSTDLPALSLLITNAHLNEAIMPFFFRDWPQHTTMLPYYSARLGRKMAEGNTVFIKATDTVTNRILGFVCMSLNTGEEVLDRHITNPGGDFVPPPGFNWKLAAVVIDSLGKLDGMMVGKKHYELSSISVSPDCQGKGIGTQLIKYCIAMADEVGMPIYLTAFPGAHDLYARLGWVDAEYFDLDLNEWGKKYRGFGIYRSYAMIRDSSKVAMNEPLI